MRKLPYLLLSPALSFYTILLLTPMFLTFLLSFNSYSMYTGVVNDYSLDNYIEIMTDSYFINIFLRTFFLSLVVTILCTALGTAEAIILFRMNEKLRSIFLLIILGPLLVSVVVRTLGWAIILGNEGMINSSLLRMGIIDEPLKIMYSVSGVIIALVHVLIPFSVISTWTALTKLDSKTIDSAFSLGASHFFMLRKVLLPQIMPGILSGSIIVFSLSITAFATPSIIGGRSIKVVATTIYDEFLTNLNWPLGAAIAISLLILNFAVIYFYNKKVEAKYKKIFQ